MRIAKIAGLALLLALAGCDDFDDDHEADVQPAPCYEHDALTYSPILVKINIDANYDLNDPNGFRSDAPASFLDALTSVSSKYQIADGVTPNLIFNITATNDGHDHFGANVTVSGNGEGYLFSFTMPQDYVTPGKLLDDIASKADGFVTSGWQRGACGN